MERRFRYPLRKLCEYRQSTLSLGQGLLEFRVGFLISSSSRQSALPTIVPCGRGRSSPHSHGLDYVGNAFRFGLGEVKRQTVNAHNEVFPDLDGKDVCGG